MGLLTTIPSSRQPSLTMQLVTSLASHPRTSNGLEGGKSSHCRSRAVESCCSSTFPLSKDQCRFMYRKAGTSREKDRGATRHDIGYISECVSCVLNSQAFLDFVVAGNEFKLFFYLKDSPHVTLLRQQLHRTNSHSVYIKLQRFLNLRYWSTGGET